MSLNIRDNPEIGTLILKEEQRFVVGQVVYKVIRKRVNWKMTIKPVGIYKESLAPPKVPTSLTEEEKKTEQEFFEEKEEPTNAKKDDSEFGEGPVPNQEGSKELGPRDSKPSNSYHSTDERKSNE